MNTANRVLIITDLFPAPGTALFAGSFVLEIIKAYPPDTRPLVAVPVEASIVEAFGQSVKKANVAGLDVVYVYYHSPLSVLLSLLGVALAWRKAYLKRIIARALNRAIRRLHADEHFTIVHGIELYAGDEAVPIAKTLGLPSVVTIHSLYSFLEGLHGKLALQQSLTNLKQADAITTVSTIAKKSYPLQIQQKMEIIPNGITARPLMPLSDELAQWLDGKTIILSAGFLIPSKRVDLVIHLAKQLQGKFSQPVVALIVGTGPEKEKLQHLTAELGVSSAVRFLSQVDPRDMPALYTAADLVVQPSVMESFSMICLEAMVYGRPFICTSKAGISEYVTDGTEGRIIPPDDLDRLVEAAQVILTDSALRRRMGEAGKATAQRLDATVIANQYLKLYHRVSQPLHG